ncbi:MAG: TetR/AcrR family transcriptional regulator [Actinobacteria bacterium]|nr:TetR/AcrR family transcriptional regulator [Actinomycetota bacterium]
MNTPRRAHTEQGLERKTQLLDAAAALFSTKGYSSTRIADICAAAGVAKGLVYWYFPTKESLFAELVRTMRQQLRRAQAAAMDPDADPVTRIRQGTEASVVFMAEHRSYFALLDVERGDDEVASVLRDGSDVYAHDVIRLVREAQELQLVPDGDPRLYATGILGAVSSYSHALRAGTLDVDATELAAFVGDWVVRSLVGDQARRPSSP